MVYSRDRGRTFVEYEGNPVIRHNGRAPKLIWHEPTQHWVMAVYDEEDKDTAAIAFYTSPDLKHWTFASKLPGYFECPEIFALPIDSAPNNIRWVVFAADAKYSIGKFDGRAFTPDHEGKHQLHHGAYYASQTFSNAPDGRRVQIGWAKIDMSGMPFNQTFSFPHQLKLRTTSDGVRLFAEPIQEIALLHKAKHVLDDKKLISDRPTELDVAGALFDIRASFEIGSANEFGLDIGGNSVTYNVAANKLNGADLKPIDGKVSMQILVDRPMIEISGNAGPRRIIYRSSHSTSYQPSCRLLPMPSPRHSIWASHSILG